jgi:hypothetical protein
MFLTERRGDPASSIAEAERQLAAAFQPRALPTPASLEGKVSNIVQLAPAWSDVESIASKLTWQNRQVIEAKGLARYESRPSDVYSFDWQNRNVKAAQALVAEESSVFFVRLAQSAAVAAVGGFAVSLALLSACAWLWAALLRRIRELSNAVRGRE